MHSHSHFDMVRQDTAAFVHTAPVGVITAGLTPSANKVSTAEALHPGDPPLVPLHVPSWRLTAAAVHPPWSGRLRMTRPAMEGTAATACLRGTAQCRTGRRRLPSTSMGCSSAEELCFPRRGVPWPACMLLAVRTLPSCTLAYFSAVHEDAIQYMSSDAYKQLGCHSP